MAAGINKVILIGNAGKDAELRFTSGGTAVAKFTLATSEKFGKAENRQERTEWHRIVVFGKLAEICGEWVKKGKQLYLEGRIQTRDWEDKEGKKHWITEIVANDILLLGGGRRDEESARRGGEQATYDDASLDKIVDDFHPAVVPQAGGAVPQAGGAVPQAGGTDPQAGGTDLGGDEDLPF